MATVYDEDLTDDEKALLEQEEAPVPAEGGEGDGAPPPADAPPAAPEGGEPQGQAPQTDDELEAFKAQHAGKSPEELLALAFQQRKRADATGFQARRTQEELQAIKDRAAKIIEDRKAAAQAKLDETEKALNEDPDEAVRRLARREYEQEVGAAEQEAQRLLDEAEIDEAVMFAAQYIPDFGERAPKMFTLGKELGFNEAELHQIRDGRQLVVLHLATVAGDLMRAGIIDPRGNILAASPTRDTPADPRLKAPAPPRNVGAGAAAAPGATPEDKLKSLAQMTDKELAALSDEDFMKAFGQ